MLTPTVMTMQTLSISRYLRLLKSEPRFLNAAIILSPLPSSPRALSPALSPPLHPCTTPMEVNLPSFGSSKDCLAGWSGDSSHGPWERIKLEDELGFEIGISGVMVSFVRLQCWSHRGTYFARGRFTDLGSAWIPKTRLSLLACQPLTGFGACSPLTMSDLSTKVYTSDFAGLTSSAVFAIVILILGTGGREILVNLRRTSSAVKDSTRQPSEG